MDENSASAAAQDLIRGSLKPNQARFARWTKDGSIAVLSVNLPTHGTMAGHATVGNEQVRTTNGGRQPNAEGAAVTRMLHLAHGQLVAPTLLQA